MIRPFVNSMPKPNNGKRSLFKELYARALDWANAFVASGLKKGDRVAMLLPNGIDAVCCHGIDVLCRNAHYAQLMQRFLQGICQAMLVASDSVRPSPTPQFTK